VEDGDSHDVIRRTMNPALHKQMLGGYIESMWKNTDQVSAKWGEKPVDMLVEMRRAALLILINTLFKVDFGPDMERMWTPILKTLEYISPGPWIIWRGIPRPGYGKALQQMDAYLYQMIQMRQANLGEANDLLGILITSGMDDHLIRDQLLTMLIAGHDTSTALLSWALYLLGKHPAVMEKARAEVDSVLGDGIPTLELVAGLRYLDQIVDETMRLYPPIHLGSRVAAVDLNFQGYTIPAGTRVMYSIFLTQRMPQYWDDPDAFKPERFEAEAKRAQTPYTFLPFGGGPRNCIGAAFAQVEAKVVLARLLQHYHLTLMPKRVRMFMGATLEPRPGVWMTVRRR
jgi:cytochrome P450